jgi:thymidine phosphorylase
MVAAKVGDQVKPGDLLCTVYAADAARCAAAVQRVQAAYTFSATPVAPLPIIYDRVVA